MPRRNVPEMRAWDDIYGVQWWLCDSCDAPVADEELFVATVADYRAQEAGAWYCRRCATEIVGRWAVRLADTTPVEKCWCGAGADCDGLK